MELHITEIDNLQTNYEQIPENMPPKASAPKINVVKQNNKVRFVDQPNIPSQIPSQTPNQNIKPYMSGPKAKMVRPTVPPTKPQVSYDDILNKLGMFVANGKLHLLDGQQQPPLNRAEVPKPHVSNPNPNPNQNTYIYNKYFQNNQYDQDQEQQQRPMTPFEYRDMLIKNIIQKHKIKQMKSTKLVMPNSNINFASGPTSNLNKLFGFSQR
jgi:hypothetical protein